MPRALAWAIIAIAIIATTTTSFAYYSYSISQAKSRDSPAVTAVSIPEGAWRYPVGFNLTRFLESTSRYTFNFTVTIGINNTVQWTNNDSVDHTVTSRIVPTGASTFDSHLIHPGKTYSLTLTVPGIYKYDCAWHPWLAGEVTVKQAQ